MGGPVVRLLCVVCGVVCCVVQYGYEGHLRLVNQQWNNVMAWADYGTRKTYEQVRAAPSYQTPPPTPPSDRVLCVCVCLQSILPEKEAATRSFAASEITRIREESVLCRHPAKHTHPPTHRGGAGEDVPALCAFHRDCKALAEAKTTVRVLSEEINELKRKLATQEDLAKHFKELVRTLQELVRKTLCVQPPLCCVCGVCLSTQEKKYQEVRGRRGWSHIPIPSFI